LRDFCSIENPYVFLYGNVRPMATQNLSTERLDLALENDSKSSLFEPQVEPAYTREERGDLV
jgi:hypothetical protein